VKDTVYMYHGKQTEEQKNKESKISFRADEIRFHNSYLNTFFIVTSINKYASRYISRKVLQIFRSRIIISCRKGINVSPVLVLYMCLRFHSMNIA
jgi:hypothetical protein